MAGTIEWRRGEPVERMIAQFEPRMLAGDEQVRWLAEVGKRMGDWA